ncbi:alpha/beta hydrolase [Rhabdaerophilum calidifontis]|uniref:alpha/beta hydrolase n=1 Tax=Rhabdaerophilum calidifontis TaxID=2604328 RepID=UPI00123A85F2|nr:alpha/beta hydrolase [Rhabdaerophilum calidifontis]
MQEAAQFLTVAADGENGFPARRLAYHHQPGHAPAILWMGGFRSDMTSTKALALGAAAAAEGRASLRFDYTAHGASTGDFLAATLSLWLDDALRMIRGFGGRRPILVGSSMGGWLALRATEILAKEGNPPGGLVLIAPAVDFTEMLMWEAFPPEIRAEITAKGVWYRPSAYSPEPYPITMRLIEDGRRHRLMTREVRLGVPVHILQGGQDPDVPLAHVEAFVARLPAEDIRMSVIPDGDHRLSREADIAALVRITLGLAREVAAL